ncbi:major facilitator superfamily transporter [Deinococcus phoenicis]|uniref:Major facilitator superfamily transporter n=1 Tax=Deinococcus phoenicis TaxID=1476583 RepID=A0A016QPW8_9DEIO|nr:MFS transporter [Deinococcus phoenicis]EYB68180.1 major facilitator superfamily transporter [Deinococcus phoenicis]
MSAETRPTAAPVLPLGRIAPLYAAQALATGATTVSTVLASLIMSSLGRESLSGLPSTLISTSAALSAGLFGALMLRSGRRLGLGLAFTLGACGAGVGFLGARAGITPLFLLGAAMMGGAQGGYQQARYAAAESVPEQRRGTALGLLMLMSVLGSFLMTGFSGAVEGLGTRLGTSAEVAGWLVGGGLLGLAALLMLLWTPAAPPAQARTGARLTVREAFAVPGVRSTALALATAQGLMVTLMSLTPLRAHHLGMDHGSVAALISGHIAGMFGFGWLTGPLIDRLGLRVGYVGGALLLAAAALTAPLPGSAWLGASMFLLGLGWNLAFVTGSKALSRYPAAQGVTDGLGYVAAGAGTLIGGLVLARAGFPLLAYACAGLALLPLVSAWRAGRTAPA